MNDNNSNENIMVESDEAERASALPGCGVPCFLSLPVGERVSLFLEETRDNKMWTYCIHCEPLNGKLVDVR